MVRNLTLFHSLYCICDFLCNKMKPLYKVCQLRIGWKAASTSAPVAENFEERDEKLQIVQASIKVQHIQKWKSNITQKRPRNPIYRGNNNPPLVKIILLIKTMFNIHHFGFKQQF